MNRWGLALFFVIVLVVSVAGAVIRSPTATDPFFPQVNSSPRPLNSPAATPSPLQPAKIAQSPKVDAERLFSHIRALNFERYRERDRSRTREYLLQTLTRLGWQPQLQQFEGGSNVVAQRAGTDPERGNNSGHSSL
ncbi:hypothetical protein K9N68_17415 [Kovacikia minuta CCNUW1]|uniref:hypothetical protein n=1 Tax=Kovacikia minuta TaxID=2931930 RepID=UPI001CCC8221|nr:hypothetical protein [Kovacikia minuta]UBF23568.1 hypothetical protein K9N68_17415 [Kovacikia minuta CCNUW1]